MPITHTNELVILKCNNCGEEICFYPATVLFPPECKCGNKDSGNCLRDWSNNSFGNFTVQYRGMETLSIPLPWDVPLDGKETGGRTVKSPPKPRPISREVIKEAVKKAPPKRRRISFMARRGEEPPERISFSVPSGKGQGEIERGNHQGWTRYHIIYTLSHRWKFYREGMKRGIKTSGDRNKVIKKALYYLCRNGGYLTVHYKDASVDFTVDNWCG